MDYKQTIIKLIESMKLKDQTPTKKGIATLLDILTDIPNTYFLMLMAEMDLSIEDGV